MITELKQQVKNKINSGNIPSTQNLFNKVKDYKAVSFDIFDTLLKRKVNKPEDVFQLMQLNIEEKIPDFKNKRIKAEEKARLINNPREITLDDIYDNFVELDERQRDYFEKLELKFEKTVLVPNKPIVDLFNECIRNNKAVFIISDMYLPLVFIKQVLDDLDISGYTKLYLSSDKHLTKRSGTLFNLYLKENNLEGKNCIHIGDSWESDYKKPRSKNIAAIHIPKITNNSSQKKLNEQYLDNFIYLNTINEEISDPYYKFGYEKFGPFLWGYVKWLHSNFKKENIKKVFFFSRDGYIMKKAYDLLYHDDIKDMYLEVSRRSLRVPVLWLNSSFENYINMISPSKLVTIQSIFDGAGLDMANYRELLSKYGFTEKSNFDRSEILSNKQLKGLYTELLSEILKKSKSEYKLLQLYLNQQGVSGKFAIVDIGWGGSMERYLTQTLNTLHIPHDIYGYYIGVADYYTKNIKEFPLRMKGYLFDFKNDDKAMDKRSSFVGLFESLFLEQAGSVENYKCDSSGKVVSNRYPYEYLNNNKPTFELISVKKIQKGAIDFIRDVQQDFILSNVLKFNADELYQGIEQTGMQPNKEDLNLFANFHFYDEGRDDKLAAPASILSYMEHPKKLKEDFLVSRWKIGFMKKIFKLPLPYQKMYEQMRKLK